MLNVNETNRSETLIMKPQSTFSPVALRYIAALRGNKPKRTGTAFTYAEIACSNPNKLICLAASNPEGRFYGFVADEATRRASEQEADKRGTFNAVFLVGTPSETLARIANGSSLPPMLDYLCCDESTKPLSAAEHAALFDLAQKRLNPGGLFTVSYRAHDRDDGALRFIVRELTPSMNDEQQQVFLTELKRLGSTYLAQHADVAARLNDAIVKGTPKNFFSLYDTAPAMSATADTIAAMRARGLSYAGDATLTSNYVELAVPVEAQELIVGFRTNPLYESIKDFAINRLVRSDIWIHSPAAPSGNPAELFGGFAYGIIMPRDQIPAKHVAQGKTIDLSGKLYGKLLDLMSLMPVGVGDVLSHPAGQGEQPEKILEALQILVACGIASPMRGQMTSTVSDSTAQPRLVGSFNRYLDKTDLTDKDVYLSSQVMGCGITFSAREAFVMQAVNRAGLTNSVSALMPELRRIAHTPASMSVIKADEATPEMALSLVRDVVGKSLPQWYAYALLEAA
ncbi:MAG: methyltransferase regulatory domain-containing protein [Alphaproteobacteria bacterium]